MPDRWFAVRSTIGGEYKARDEIRDELGLDVYLPMRRYHITIRGKRSSRWRPLLPGYLFVCCDMNFVFMNAIRERDNVIDVVRKMDSWEPAPIPDSAMEVLAFMEWQKGAELEAHERWQQDIRQGNVVEFLSGLLKGEQFRVLKLDADGQIRLASLRDRTVRLKTPRTAVERVA